MVVKWEGENPPDTGAWFDVLSEALGDEAGSYWVRFYREPGGWRFDLGRHRASGSLEPNFARADESTALRVYTLLVESGKPLDPGWRPLAPSQPAAIVRRPVPVVAPVAPPVGEAPPAPLGEAPQPAAEGSLPAGGRRGRRRRRRHQSPTPPEPVRETTAEPVGATPPTPVLETEPPPEPEPPAEPQAPTAPRPPRWRGLRPAVVYLPALLLVAFAGWLSRGRLLSRPPPPPVPSPSATMSQEVLTSQKRLLELEAVVAQLKQERAQVLPGRRPAAPAPIGATQQASGRRPTQPAEKRADEMLAPTPALGPTPTPVTTPVTEPAAAPAPTDIPVPTGATVPAAPVPAAATEPPPTPSPVERGAMVDVNDPGLTRPVPVTRTQPLFPPLALARRISGTVWLQALVDETGAVVEVSLIRASPRGLGFEDAATGYLRTRVYRPATKQGVPVRVWLPIVVEFRHPAP